MRTRLLVLPLLLLAAALVSCDDGGPAGSGVPADARFTWPIDGSYSSVSDSVRLNAFVLANGAPLQNAAVSWRSDLDGPLAAGRTGEQGWVSVPANKLPTMTD